MFIIVNVPLLPAIFPVNHYYFLVVRVDLVHVAGGSEAIHPYEQVRQWDEVLPEHVLQEEWHNVQLKPDL